MFLNNCVPRARVLYKSVYTDRLSFSNYFLSDSEALRCGRDGKGNEINEVSLDLEYDSVFYRLTNGLNISFEGS